MIARLRGYHGVTIASGSLTGLPYNHASFDLPIDGILHTASPHHWREHRPGEDERAFSARCAAELEALIEREGADTIAAFFGEPVMGAGGVIVPPAGYWEAIQAVLRRHDILLVADEVICGFGRTGRWFGSETCDLEPDVIVVSKQLSSSYLPISALLVNERVFEPIADESHRIGVLGHGYTGSGHPVAAAVALENLRIIEEDGLVENCAALAPHFLAHLHALAEEHPLVGEARGVGLIGALELVVDKPARRALGKPGALGRIAAERMLEHGVISRAMTDALAFCPPLIITRAQIDELFAATPRRARRDARDLARGGSAGRGVRAGSHRPDPLQLAARALRGAGAALGEIAQHVVQDAAVAVVVPLGRRVDAHLAGELGERAVLALGAHRDAVRLPPRPTRSSSAPRPSARAIRRPFRPRRRAAARRSRSGWSGGCARSSRR